MQCMPVQIDVTYLDHGNCVESTLKEQKAKWHKSCYWSLAKVNWNVPKSEGENLMKNLQPQKVLSHASSVENHIPAFIQTVKPRCVSSLPNQKLLKSESSLFARLCVACETRDHDLCNFYSRENHSFPPSLLSDGQLRLGGKFGSHGLSWTACQIPRWFKARGWCEHHGLCCTCEHT